MGFLWSSKFARENYNWNARARASVKDLNFARALKEITLFLIKSQIDKFLSPKITTNTTQMLLYLTILKMSKNNEEKKPVLSLLWDFFGYTTAHGFARISESKTFLQRAVWFVIVGAAFVMFFIQVFTLLSTYLSRPIGTQITMKHESVGIVKS